MRLYIGLLHYPVYNKNNQKIASAITNFDLHDLSRLSRTYGVANFFVITPLADQQQHANRILKHWIKGYGADYNRDRKKAFKLVRIISSYQEAIKKIHEIEGENPLLIATSASGQMNNPLSYARAKEILGSEKTCFLIFGTAWGLHEEIINKVDYILEPIQEFTDYNHLSVRTAAAITLDRLAGNYR